MSEWKVWNGFAEQLNEMKCSEEGFIIKNSTGTESSVLKMKDFESNENLLDYVLNYDSMHYLIITKDPLRNMKIRQAETGQPVWFRSKFISTNSSGSSTCFPDWNMKDVDFSFSPFNETKS